MFDNIYDFQAFYNTPAGLIVRETVTTHLRKSWPDLQGLVLAGSGYAQPYLEDLMQGVEDRVICFSPADFGGQHWPLSRKNALCVGEDRCLPFAANTIDRMIMVHHLEFTRDARALMDEIWRILTPQGRVIIVVPNRLSWWSHMDWSPFGHGRPFSGSQIGRLVRDSSFVLERTHQALYALPSRSQLILNTAPFFEKYAKLFMPGLAGISMVEISKQLYRGLLHPVQMKPVTAPINSAATAGV